MEGYFVNLRISLTGIQLSVNVPVISLPPASQYNLLIVSTDSMLPASTTPGQMLRAALVTNDTATLQVLVNSDTSVLPSFVTCHSMFNAATDQ